MAQDQRVAVGPGPRDFLGGDGALAAALVFDDDLLAQVARHFHGHGAGHDVGTAAGAVGHEQADGALRPGVGGVGGRHGGQQQGGGRKGQRGAQAGSP